MAGGAGVALGGRYSRHQSVRQFAWQTLGHRRTRGRIVGTRSQSMKTRNWAAVTFLVVIFTAASMMWMGWFGSGRHNRASAAPRSTPQAVTPAKGEDIMDSQAAWRYRRNQSPNWKVAMCYHP